MRQKLTLISKMPPSVNHYLAYRVVKSPKGYIATSYKTKEATNYQKDFEKYVLEEVEKQNWKIEEIGDRHIYVETKFYFPRTDMDCNNYFKVLLDAITNTKKVWKDDNIVCEKVIGIRYDSKNPHIEMSIYPVEYIGIFDNSEKLEAFEENCKKCCRYSKNCKLLKRVKSGHIEEGVTQDCCSHYKEIRKNRSIRKI